MVSVLSIASEIIIIEIIIMIKSYAGSGLGRNCQPGAGTGLFEACPKDTDFNILLLRKQDIKSRF